MCRKSPTTRSQMRRHTNWARSLGVTAFPVFTRIARWPGAMANPVGHPARMAELRERMAAILGLNFAWNAVEVIGIPDCVQMRRGVARAITGAWA